MPVDHVAIIAEESARMRAIVAAGPATARVPGCPDWSLEQLGRHLADVQRWAAGIITSGVQCEPEPLEPPPATAADALAISAEELVAALSAADRDDPGWNFFGAPQVKDFWFRRQCNEVALHRWDAESAVSDEPNPLAPEVAAEVIDEYLRVMLPRVMNGDGMNRDGIDLSPIGALDHGDIHLHCTDAGELGDVPGEWTFEVVDGALRVSGEHRKAAVAIRAEASTLALFLYNRLNEDAVEIFGDRSVLATWAPVLGR